MLCRLKVLGLVFVVALAVGGALSGSASAVGLPQFSVETKFTGSSGRSKFVLSGAEVTCSKGTSEGSPVTGQGGSLTLAFRECKLGGSECHSLGDAREVILLTGAYVLVRLKAEDPGVLLALEETHIECALLSTLVLLRGEVLGLITPFRTKTTRYTDNEKLKEGKQEFTEYENSVGEKEAVSLEGSINGGEFKAVTEESTENTLTTATETEIEETRGPLTIDGEPRLLLQGSRQGRIVILNTSATESIEVERIGSFLEDPRGSFRQTETEVRRCVRLYRAGESCSWRIEYLGTVRSRIFVFFRDRRGGGAEQRIRGQ
jgi:hypothetical protein